MVKEKPDQIDVSIIIVCFNSFNLLRQCLDSLMKFSKGISYEIIIVDNNSTEGDIDEIVAKYNITKLIRNFENKGFGAANNQGLKIARGKYILFLNTDTILFENSINKVFEYAEILNNELIIGCKLLNRDKTLQFSAYDFPSLLNIFTSNLFIYRIFPKSRLLNKYHLMSRKIEVPVEADTVTGAFLFGNREFIKNIGGFDERFHFYNEETDLCFRFKKKGGHIYYFPKTAIIHLKGGTANKNLYQRYKNESIATIKYYQKHFRGLSFFLAVSLHYFGLLIRIPIFFIAGVFTANKNLILRSAYNFKNLWEYPKNIFRAKN